MSDAQTNPAPIARAAAPRLAAFGVIGLAGILAGLLWWRFGEAVYASGLMGALLACF